MTRLKSASLDYAIACLARGQRPASLEQLREYVDGDAYSRAVQDLADAECKRRRATRDSPDLRLRRGIEWGECLTYGRRIVRAWLALYLRRVRRGMAFERFYRGFDGCSWSIPPWPGPAHPLWFDAAQHDPLVSPWQRHGLPRRKRQESA